MVSYGSGAAPVSVFRLSSKTIVTPFGEPPWYLGSSEKVFCGKGARGWVVVVAESMEKNPIFSGWPRSVTVKSCCLRLETG